MTDPAPRLSFEDAEANAEQAIRDFEADDGLELRARRHSTGTDGDDFLELHGRARLPDGVHALSYRASRTDLEDAGDAWFTRRALRSLNDLYRAGHLPATSGQESEYQYLKPQQDYER